MINVVIVLFFFLVICVGGILLQIFLSKQENKWAGLILPLITLIISLLAVFSVAIFSTVGETQGITQITNENGVMVQEAVTESVPATQIINTSGAIVMVVMVFLLYNIPTVILLAIYAACRGKGRRQRALDKMSVQDLE